MRVEEAANNQTIQANFVKVNEINKTKEYLLAEKNTELERVWTPLYCENHVLLDLLRYVMQVCRQRF